MAFSPLVWYCRPEANGVWARAVDSAFGAYTPCATNSLVIVVSHLVLIGHCFYRMWLTKKDPKVQRYILKSKLYTYMLGFLAAYSTTDPLFRLVMGISVLNLDRQTGLAPYEIVSLIIESLAWCSMTLLVGLETKVYIYEFRWFIRFGVIYTIVGDTVILNLVLSLKELYSRSVLFLYFSAVFVQPMLGILLFVYVPNLDPYPGYTAVQSDSTDDAECEELPGGEQICPERHANLFAKITFGWMNSLLKQGYRRPITENDVWKLDTWDRTETLTERFQKSWTEELRRPKPWLLRALNSNLGGRLRLYFANL